MKYFCAWFKPSLTNGLLPLVLFAAYLVSGLQFTHAANWDATSGDWYSSNNWNPTLVPTSLTTIYIDNSGESIIDGGSAFAGQMYVGFNNSGNLLRIEDGASLVASSFRIGQNSGSEGHIIVSGAGTTFQSDLAYLGWSGTSTMEILNGATWNLNTATVITMRMGQATGSSSILRIAGEDSLLAVSSSFSSKPEILLNEGDATIEVLAGGKITTATINSSTVGGNYLVTIDGVGSRIELTENFYFRNEMQASVLAIAHGGVLEAGSLSANGKNHQLSVSGQGSLLDIGVALNLDSGSDPGAVSLEISNLGAVVVGGGSILGAEGSTNVNISTGGFFTTNGGVHLGWEATGAGVVSVDDSTWTANGIIRVGVAGEGTLQLSNESTLNTSADVSLGFAEGSNGSLTVQGNSIWNAGSATFVGRSGEGFLGIGTQSEANTLGIVLGEAASGVGSMAVIGMGSQIKNSGHLNIGNTGKGEVLVLDGATLSTRTTALGQETTGDGKLQVSGINSEYVHSNAANTALIVGAAGKGDMEVLFGGKLSTASNNGLLLGQNSGSTGKVTVSGMGSSITVGGVTQVGNSGAGTLSVNSGGTMETNGLSVAVNASSNSLVEVVGVGSVLSVTGTSTRNIATAGTASFNILGGGKFYSNNGELHIASSANSNATVTISGSGSELTATNIVGIGRSGTANLTIANGGKLTAANPYLGVQPGGSGTVTVTGSGSELEATTRLWIGNFGTGSATIQNGATLRGAVSLGTGSNGTGSLLVESNSTWDFTNQSVTIGSSANTNATVTINGDSTVIGQTVSLGALSSSIGNLTIAHGGTTFTLNNLLRVGNLGTATVEVSQAANLMADRIEVGQGTSSTGLVVVNGMGTTLTSTSTSAINGNMVVGDFGKGTLLIENGGSVAVLSGARVGHQYSFAGSGNGTVTVTGTGSEWSVALGISLANAASTVGVVNLNDQGLIKTSNVSKGHAPAAAKFAFDGGELRLTANQAALFSSFSAGEVELKTAGGTINTQSFDVSTNASIGGEGGVTKSGTGRLRMTGAHTYTGSTTLLQGTMTVDGAGSINETSSLTINGAVLQYSSSVDYAGGAVNFVEGTLSGTNWQGNLSGLTIGENQVIAPGNSPGTAMGVDQTWAGLGRYEWEIDNATGVAGTNWDSVDLSGILTLTSSTIAPFVVEVKSLLDDHSPGQALNFDLNTSYTWLIASAGTTISSFDPSIFSVDLTYFVNPYNGTWLVGRGDLFGFSDNELYLRYSAISSPVPEPTTALLVILGAGVLWGRSRRKALVQKLQSTACY